LFGRPFSGASQLWRGYRHLRREGGRRLLILRKRLRISLSLILTGTAAQISRALTSVKAAREIRATGLHFI
jgi:hypothetical protein